MIYQTDLKLGQEIEIVKEFLKNEAHRYQGKLLCLDEYLQLFNTRNQHSITYSMLGRSQGYIGASGSRVLITIQNQ